jgi:lysozyme
LRGLVIILLATALAACGGPRTNAPESRAHGTPTPVFADHKPHDWTEVRPWDYPVHGIDVSKWQGEIDWRQVRASGVAFAYIKATEGGDHADDRFAANWAAARAAGVPRGAYHFYYFCRPAQEQVRWFAANVPRERGALPPVLDVEWNATSRTCRTRPAPETVRREMGIFLAEVGRHYGKRPVIYTSVDFYHDNELWKVKGHHFWLRSVANHPSAIYKGQDWAFWQYTGTGVVPGVKGRADINAFAGSPAQWRRWLAANAL